MADEQHPYRSQVGKMFRPKAAHLTGLRYKVIEFKPGHNFGGILGSLPAFKTQLLQNPAAELFHPVQVFLVENELVPEAQPKPETQPITTG